MANFNTRVQMKNDIEANWQQAVNFKPLLGEVIIYRAEKDGDALPKDPNNPSQNLRNYYITYPRIKVGDGSTNVNDLPFIDSAIHEQLATITLLRAEDDDMGNVSLISTALSPASEGAY